MKSQQRRSILTGGAGLALAGLGLTGCGAKGKRQIAVIPKGRAHVFWQSVHAGAEKAAQESGVEIVWNGPQSEADYATQIQIVDAMINRRVDAICLAPTDSKALVSVAERAVAQKIPVVIFDSGIDMDKFVSQVATDNEAAGGLAAARMGELLGGQGKIALLATQPGGASTMAREKGFEEGIKKFPGITIVDKKFGMSDYAKSLAVAENMLTAFPDLAGIFSSNESGTVGAAQALKGRKGSKVKAVGFDSSEALLGALREGVVDSLVVQDPFRMGYEAVLAALAALEGKPVEKIKNMPPLLVTKANMDEASVKERLFPDLKKYLK